ncbi:MAG TPA: hypothetical protein VHZ33_22225 [Trebonia sp.]|nr:hypothetical protein [Trebonia sp.]
MLRNRLQQLNDSGLPPNERVHDLVVDRMVMGEGRFRWDGPLVDPAARIPYSRTCRPRAPRRSSRRRTGSSLRSTGGG